MEARRAAVILILGAALAGCSTVNFDLKQDAFYRRDIAFKVNGTPASGTYVAPLAPSYKIEGEVQGNFDYLFIRSCHREYTAEREGNHFSYTYVPVAGIEDVGACPLEIHGLEKNKGRDSFGFIDFENPRDLLGAQLNCNGVAVKPKGVATCQAPAGLIQRLIFQAPVISEAADPRCRIVEPADLKTYEFKLQPKRCMVVFQEKDVPHRTLRLNLLGYEDVVVRDF